MRQVLALTGSVSFVLTWFYLVYVSDSVGAVTGVFFSLFVFPAILWVVLAAGITFATRTRITMNIADWGWLFASVAGAYSPVFLILIFLSFGH